MSIERVVMFIATAVMILTPSTTGQNVNTNNVELTDNEIQCMLNGTVLYKPDGKCYRLLEKGPCQRPNDWLVLRLIDNSRLETMCTTCHCCKETSTKKIYWPRDGQCHRSNDEVCASGNKLYNDFDGLGYCDCKDAHARPRTQIDRQCFPLFERSTICPQGQYFVVAERRKNALIGECVTNPCVTDNLAPWTEDGNFDRDRRHCYELNSVGPCNNSDEIFRVFPSDPSIVGCYNVGLYSSFNKQPTICNPCRPSVSLSGGSGKPTLSNQLLSFLNRKRFGTSEETQPSGGSVTTSSTNQTHGEGEAWIWD